ncbi:Coiled-coil domain-containing protein 174 [Blattella germanica]|nr:Coiled-coil domain-containing protein 174 [Blattella germanica]
MNSSRKIEISKASLVSLKAELSRKQDEVNKAKAQGAYIHPVPRPKKQTIWTKQNAGVSKRDEKDLEQEQEDEDVLKKSRAALEAKSKLYNKLSHDASGHDNQFLVDFEQKANEVEEEETFPEEYDDPSDSEDEWVDYEDCLGRTRRCLRKDLVHIKEKDAELFKSLGGGDVEEKEAEAETAAPELQSGDMRREALRQKWEQQEEELRKKSDIHYQDVLFDGESPILLIQFKVFFLLLL